MRIRFISLILFAAMLSVAGSCSSYKNYEASRPANVMQTESRLTKAGFRMVPIETPDQNGAVAQLPMHQLNRYDSAKGSVYWYLDPTVCQCLYEGDPVAYENYVALQQQENDTAEYVNDTNPNQVVNLTPFGYAFPPPLLLGAWPVIVPGGGGAVASNGGRGGSPFHSAGSGRGHGGISGRGGGGHR